ncbi:MAG: hypothetical protein R8G66_17135 [Cytophagales bacterium]|nr:hypothetical protein [Cytophagales bacterium]
MNLKHLLLALIVFFSGEVSAQSDPPEKKRGITLGFGLQTFLVNDEIGSNLNYNGNALSLHIQHDVYKKRQSRAFNFFLVTPNIENDFNNNVLDGVSIALDFHWRYQMNMKLPWDLVWYIGPYAKAQGFARTYNFETNGVEINTGEVFGTIGLSSLMRKELTNEKYLLFAVRGPVATYMINREFIGSTTREWMFPDRFADYQLRLSLFGKTLKAAEWMVAYQYQITVIDRASRVGYEGHLFETGLKFTY